MKVKKLVQLLIQLPPDAEIGVQTRWNWISRIDEVQPIEKPLKWTPSLQNLWECTYIIKTEH